MKKLKFLLFLLAYTPCLIAQQYFPSGYNHDFSRDRRILQLLREQETTAAERPTGIKQRVVAQSSHDGSYYDSTIFRYSGTRGSRFNHNAFMYPRGLDIVYDSTYPRVAIPFDLLADTIVHKVKDTLYYTDWGVYQQDNRLSEISTDYNPDQYPIYHTRMKRTYNANGTDKLHYYWEYNTASPIDTNSCTKYAYLNGKHIIDSIAAKVGGVWRLAGINKYNYNTEGRLSGDSSFSFDASADTLILTRGSFINYYPDNKVKDYITHLYSDGILIQKQTDSFGYQAGVTYPTFWRNDLYMLAFSRHTSVQEIRYPGSAGLPDSAITSYTNSNNVTSTRRYKYSYNSMSNPERITVFNTGNTGEIPDSYYKFYYDTYDDGLVINEATFQHGVSVYPNPFSQYLVIKLAQVPTSSINCELINALGQVISTQIIKPQLGDNRIEVQTLPNGVYFLRLWNTEGHLFGQRVLKTGI